MATKHLILIHGRATKPNKVEKCRLLKKSLLSGLAHVDNFAAKAIEENRVKLSFAYYGDLLNNLLVAANPGLAKNMVRENDSWFERSNSYDADLARLLERPVSKFTAADYEAFLETVRDGRGLDDLARILSPGANFVGLTEAVIKNALPDLGAYLKSRVVASAIRERLQEPLLEALKAGDDIALVSHSMGCIVSYDVLWKFSRMSEYRSVWDRKVSLWLTLGNPLGEPAVKCELYDSNEPYDGKYPANIGTWLNISAHDDYVAHDGDVADDFNEMLQVRQQGRPLIGRIEDSDRIYNFWAGQDGSNPHKFYGYLCHHAVAEHLATWIRA